MPLQFDDQSLRMLNEEVPVLDGNGQIPIDRLYRDTTDLVRVLDDARQWAQVQMQAARGAEAREARQRGVNQAIPRAIYPPRQQGVHQLMLTELSRQDFRYLSELLSTDAVPEVVSKERFDKWWDVKALPLPG